MAIPQIDYNYGFISPVPLDKLRAGWPRDGWDVFNAKYRAGYNPNYSKPGDAVGHKGPDLASLVTKCPVVASADGVIRFAGQGSADAGGLIEIFHDGPGAIVYLTRQMHFKLSDILVSKGQSVTKGQVIAYMGMEGNANYLHTHFEIRISDAANAKTTTTYGSVWGTPLDPEDFGILTGEPTGPELPESVRVTIDRPVLRRVLPYATVRDSAVAELQGLLAERGHISTAPGVNFDLDKLRFDGLFGPSTDAGVMGFQSAEGLTVDGVVGSNTWLKLLDR